MTTRTKYREDRAGNKQYIYSDVLNSHVVCNDNSIGSFVRAMEAFVAFIPTVECVRYFSDHVVLSRTFVLDGLSADLRPPIRVS